MKTVNATQLKKNLGAVLAMVAQGPLAIERHGRVIAHLVPPPANAARKRERPADELPGLTREQEERLLNLCASGDFRPTRWKRAGEPRMLAGVAAMLASLDVFDRTRLFALAESLHPGMGTFEGYSKWLETSPVRLSRFMPMLRARLKERAATEAST